MYNFASEVTLLLSNSKKEVKDHLKHGLEQKYQLNKSTKVGLEPKYQLNKSTKVTRTAIWPNKSTNFLCHSFIYNTTNPSKIIKPRSK